jgi:hypothetical protein
MHSGGKEWSSTGHGGPYVTNSGGVEPCVDTSLLAGRVWESGGTGGQAESRWAEPMWEGMDMSWRMAQGAEGGTEVSCGGNGCGVAALTLETGARSKQGRRELSAAGLRGSRRDAAGGGAAVEAVHGGRGDEAKDGRVACSQGDACGVSPCS